MTNNRPNRDKEAVAEKLRQGLEDPEKMKEFAADLRLKKNSNSADTIDRFSQNIRNHGAFLKEHRKNIKG